MLGPIIEILFGLAVWKLLPSFITTAKKKQRKKIALWCNIVGAIIVIVGGIHLITSLFGI